MRANLILLFATLFICLIIAEMVMRYVIPPRDERAFVNYRVYRFDEKLGWASQPGSKEHIVEKRLGLAYDVSINSFGMRDKEVSLEKDSRARIAFLGDSMLWGQRVNEGERFTDLLGENPAIEPLNFGVAGYGPIQYYLMIDQVIAFKPDLVILTFTLNNDWLDNLYPERYTYYKPYAALDENDELVIKGYPVRDIRRFGYRDEPYVWFPLLRKSALAVSTALAIRRLLSPIDHVEGISFNMMYYPQTLKTDHDREYYNRAIRINHLLLKGIRDRLAQHNIPLLIVSTPTTCEYNSYCEKERVEHNKPNMHSLKPLIDNAAALGIEFFDLVPFFTPDDFLPRDTHYNREGHQKFATHLEAYLKKTRPEWFAPDNKRSE